MHGNQRHSAVKQVATILGYQTMAMGLMLLGAGFISDVGNPAAVETAQAVECSPEASAALHSTRSGDFLDLTVAWLFD